MDKEDIKEVCRLIRPYFYEKLGSYTHKRVSDDWYFHGLGFVKDGMFYVFGYYLGFFRVDYSENYNYVGMNVLIRRNGTNPELREKYYQFLKQNLEGWYSFPETEYTSERGEIGAKFTNYKLISDFKDKTEMVEFLKQCIDGIYKMYPKVIENHDNMFHGVFRAAPPWDTTIVNLCKKQTDLPVE